MLGIYPTIEVLKQTHLITDCVSTAIYYIFLIMLRQQEITRQIRYKKQLQKRRYTPIIERYLP